jgi:outer membrane protein assembly factor BamB
MRKTITLLLVLVLVVSSSVTFLPVYVASSNNTHVVATQLWNFTTQLSKLPVPLVVADGFLYAVSYYSGGTLHYMYCLNASTGDQIWSFSDEGNNTRYTPIVSDGRVYIGTLFNGVYCLDASTGVKLWHFKGGSSSGWPVVAGNYAYVGCDNYSTLTNSSDGFVYCLDASTGKEVWNYTKQGTSFYSLQVVSGYVYAVSNVFTEEPRSYNSAIYALNASTGNGVWHVATPGFLYPPLVDGSNVYVSSTQIDVEGALYDGRVYVFNAADGSQLWSFNAGANVTSPTVVDDVVLFRFG